MAHGTRIVNFDALKAKIAEQVDPIDLLERRMDVEFVGPGKARCPLPDHDDEHPSFSITPEGLWHCFSCKGGGDLYGLVELTQHLDFVGAVRWLAEDLDIDVEEFSRPPTQLEHDQQELRSSLREWFGRCTPYDGGGRVSRETAGEIYGLVHMDAAAPAVVPRYLGTGDYLIPYLNGHGQLTGFKVRKQVDGERKMLRTPKDFAVEEPIIWGLPQALPHLKDGLLTIVEGEFDAMALYDHGVKSVAALGGSSFSPEMLDILKQHHVKSVLFLMDGDRSGTEAIDKIASEYWNNEIQIYVAQTWSGSDPADMLQAGLVENLLQIIEQREAALAWLVRREYEAREPKSLTERIDFVEWISRSFGGRIGNARHQLVLRQVAEWMGLDESDFHDITRANLTVLQAPDSERVVLSKAIVDRNYYMSLRKVLEIGDFYLVQHQRIFDTLGQMLVDGQEFDVVTLRRRAEERGVKPEVVDEIVAVEHSNYAFHESRVLDMSVRRSSREDADRFRAEVGDLETPIENTIGALTHAVTDKVLARAARAATGLREQVDETVEKIHQQVANPDKVRGIAFGSQFPSLVRGLSGFQRRRVYTVAATSGQGKSTICIQFLTAISLMYAVPTELISLEMDPDEILIKIASHLTGIDSQQITNGELTKEELIRVEKSLMKIRNSPLRIYAPDGINGNELLLYARESVLERRTELFVVDFVQQMAPNPHQIGSNKYDYLGDAAYMVKHKICRGLDCSAVLVAQLRRDAGIDPTPEDMGDSYEIVRASDCVILLSQTETGSHVITVGKNRGGAGNGLQIPCVYDMPTQTWREAAGDKIPSYGLRA